MPSYTIPEEDKHKTLIWRVTEKAAGHVLAELSRQRLLAQAGGDEQEARKFMNALKAHIEGRICSFEASENVRLQCSWFGGKPAIALDSMEVPGTLPYSTTDLFYAFLEQHESTAPGALLPIETVENALRGLQHEPLRPGGGLGGRLDGGRDGQRAGYGTWAKAAGGGAGAKGFAGSGTNAGGITR